MWNGNTLSKYKIIIFVLQKLSTILKSPGIIISSHIIWNLKEEEEEKIGDSIPIYNIIILQQPKKTRNLT